MIPRKRFWTEATAEPLPEGGFVVRLDARPLRTPARAALVLPTRAFAEAVAAEWAALPESFGPEDLPFTRAANVAIDRIAAAPDPVVDQIAAYGETDLICYRAERPAALVARQADAWDPPMRWSAEALGAPLVAVAGIVHAAQPPASLAALRRAVAAHDAFALTALHELVTLSGSLVIGLAVSAGATGAEAGWALSRVDEAWQAEQWGEDAEAAALAALKRADFLRAADLLKMLAP
jgi:chaperone required for assembly of F1-ATPase